MRILIKTNEKLGGIEECKDYIKLLNTFNGEYLYYLNTPYGHINIPCYKRLIHLHNSKKIKIIYIINNIPDGRIISREISKYISTLKHPYISDITIYNQIIINGVKIIPIELTVKDENLNNEYIKLIIYVSGKTGGHIGLKVWDDFNIKTILYSVEGKLKHSLLKTTASRTIVELMSMKKLPSLTSYIKILSDDDITSKIKKMEVFNENTEPYKIITNKRTKRDWLHILFLTSNFLVRHYKLFSEEEQKHIAEKINESFSKLYTTSLQLIDSILYNNLTAFDTIIKTLPFNELSVLGLRITFNDDSKLTIPLFIALRMNKNIILFGNIKELQKPTRMKYYNTNMKFTTVTYKGKKYKNAIINGKNYPINVSTLSDWISWKTNGLIKSIITNFDAGINVERINDNVVRSVISRAINSDGGITLKFDKGIIKIATIIVEGLGEVVSKNFRKFTAYTQHTKTLTITNVPYNINFAVFNSLIPESNLEEHDFGNYRIIVIDIFKFI